MAEPQPNSPQPEAPAESAQDEVKDASPAVEEEEEAQPPLEISPDMPEPEVRVFPKKPLVDAFTCDLLSPTVFEKLGMDTFVKLSTNFYRRVYADSGENAWFREMFKDSTIEQAIQNQYEFFVQRLGGPPIYSQRKGHPALRARHSHFFIDPKAVERWLYHMRNTLVETTEIPYYYACCMYAFFYHIAHFLCNVDKDGYAIYGPMGKPRPKE